MTLVRWNPWRSTLVDTVNQVFNEAARAFDGESDAAWHPRVDIYEREGDLVLEAEVPGLNASDLDISVENNLLTLRGTRSRSAETKANDYYRSERSFGAFSRSFTLPSTVGTDKISASYKDGVLTIVLPRAEEAKPKQIPVKAA